MANATFVRQEEAPSNVAHGKIAVVCCVLERVLPARDGLREPLMWGDLPAVDDGLAIVGGRRGVVWGDREMLLPDAWETEDDAEGARRILGRVAGGLRRKVSWEPAGPWPSFCDVEILLIWSDGSCLTGMRFRAELGSTKIHSPKERMLGALVRSCMVSAASSSLCVDQRRTRVASAAFCTACRTPDLALFRNAQGERREVVAVSSASQSRRRPAVECEDILRWKLAILQVCLPRTMAERRKRYGSEKV
jgi:hypothetical protein